MRCKSGAKIVFDVIEVLRLTSLKEFHWRTHFSWAIAFASFSCFSARAFASEWYLDYAFDNLLFAVGISNYVQLGQRWSLTIKVAVVVVIWSWHGSEFPLFRCASISWNGYGGSKFFVRYCHQGMRSTGQQDKRTIVLQEYMYTTLNPYNLTTLKLYNLNTLKPENLTTLKP